MQKKEECQMSMEEKTGLQGRKIQSLPAMERYSNQITKQSPNGTKSIKEHGKKTNERSCHSK